MRHSQDTVKEVTYFAVEAELPRKIGLLHQYILDCFSEESLDAPCCNLAHKDSFSIGSHQQVINVTDISNIDSFAMEVLAYF